MSRPAKYEIVNSDPNAGHLLIRDLGPWSEHKTVTNDAEIVVGVLAHRGLLPAGRRLFYFDSEGELDEIVVKDGKFAGFKTADETSISTAGYPPRQPEPYIRGKLGDS